MSGTKNRPHKRRNIILLVLLALLCIGGVELLVCRFAAPELFQRLTAPVAGLMQRVSDFGEARPGSRSAHPEPKWTGC